MPLHRPTAWYDTTVKDNGTPLTNLFSIGEHCALRQDTEKQYTLVKRGAFCLLIPETLSNTSGMGKILPRQAMWDRQLRVLTPSQTDEWFPGLPKVFRGVPIRVVDQSPWVDEPLWMAMWDVKFIPGFPSLAFEICIERQWLEAVLKSPEREGILAITLLHEWTEIINAWKIAARLWPNAPLGMLPHLMRAVQAEAHAQTIIEVDGLPSAVEYLNKLREQNIRLGLGKLVKQIGWKRETA